MSQIVNSDELFIVRGPRTGHGRRPSARSGGPHTTRAHSVDGIA